MSINNVIDSMGIPENEFSGAENFINDSVSGGELPETKGIYVGLYFKNIIFTETGPEDDYINHPLNFARSEGLGQVIRGVTGFIRKFTEAGSLRLAILDIIFGLMKFKNERTTGNEHLPPSPLS